MTSKRRDATADSTRRVSPSRVRLATATAVAAGSSLGGCSQAPPEPGRTTSSASFGVTAPAAPRQPAADLATVKCRADMACIWQEGGCIDRWEASAGAGQVGTADGKGTTVVAESAAGKMPLTGVTQEQATAACKNAGKRLCKDAEWKSACRGEPRQEGKDHDGYESTDYPSKRCWDWDASDGGKSGPTKTGSLAQCKTAQGVFDLTGNVGEHVDAPLVSDKRVIRGGTYNMIRHDSACDSSGYRVAPDQTGPDIGFRCCRDAL